MAATLKAIITYYDGTSETVDLKHSSELENYKPYKWATVVRYDYPTEPKVYEYSPQGLITEKYSVKR